MTEIQRFQLRYCGKWPEGQRIVKCDRGAGSALGNPFGQDDDLRTLESWLRYSQTPVHTLTGSGKLRCWCPAKARAKIAELALDPPDFLGCWCKPDSPDCHVTVLLKLIAEQQEQLALPLPFLP